MELLLEPNAARKVLLLQNSQSEVLVLTSANFAESWSRDLTDALKTCAQRGLRAKVLLNHGRSLKGARLQELLDAGVEVRQCRPKFPWLHRPLGVQGEFWIFDRSEAVTVNERISRAAATQNRNLAMSVECLVSSEVAVGAATYFDLRWNAGALPVAYSVRHKTYAFHSGKQASREFFGCLLSAKKEITISLPGSRVSKGVETALHASLRDGLAVTIFANAESDDAPGLRRLRRLAVAGATVKICGRRLRSECLVVDEESVFMGSLPGSWTRWLQGPCPVFVLQDPSMSREIVAALESQVSIEINGSPSSQFYAYR